MTNNFTISTAALEWCTPSVATGGTTVYNTTPTPAYRYSSPSRRIELLRYVLSWEKDTKPRYSGNELLCCGSASEKA
jgi:hypothetical protein